MNRDDNLHNNEEVQRVESNQFRKQNYFDENNSQSSGGVNPEGEENTTFLINKPKPPKKNKLSILMLILIGSLLGSTITMAVGYYYLPQVLNMRGIVFAGNHPQITIEPISDLTVFSAVARKAMPSVVGITSTIIDRGFFGQQRRSSIGTGVIVDGRGYILTNSHVVGDGNAEEIIAILYDGERLPAKVIWNERSLDLAVIKVEANNLPVADLGDSDELEVGEIAVAIGNPMGLNFERTLTQGVISGLNRTIQIERETIENLIQTDASINPGNSGGPLLNARGQVIGINTIKVRTGEGLGFAIPINTARPIVEQIIETGEFTRVYLGITPVDIQEFSRATGIDLNVEYGIYVVRVFEDSPAETYGILTGDIITRIGNQPVKTVGSLLRELFKYRPGDRITVTLIRNGREMEIEVEFK